MTSGHSRMVCLCDPGTRIQRQKENRVICVIRAKKKINHATLMHRERTKLLDNDNKLLEYLQQGQKVTTSPIPSIFNAMHRPLPLRKVSQSKILTPSKQNCNIKMRA